MKLFVFGVLMALQVTTFVPAAKCQDTKAVTERLHFRISCTGCRSAVSITADSMQRDISRTPYNPVIQMKGNVEIRMMANGWSADTPRYMILRADEADYNEDTGQIDPRGNVRVQFESSK